MKFAKWRSALVCALVCALVWAAVCAAVSPAIVRAQATSAPASTRPTGFARWEKEISAFEAQDKTSPPPKNGLLFTGSSSIRLWKSLPGSFPDATIVNRGFGGSTIADATHFADRIIFPYEPKAVFLRAGGNDIHAGEPVERVFVDYKDFVAKVRSKMPDVPIVFIGQSPAPSRWADRDKVKRLNELVEQYTKETPGLKYIETYDLTVTPDGTPREELFIKDKLHPNEEGYKLMAQRIRPVVDQVAEKK